MRALRTAVAALLVFGLSTSGFGGDLEKSIAKAAQQAGTQSQKTSGSKAMVWAGTALFVGEWRAVAGVALVYAAHWHKARREEALLTREFGVTYEQNRGRTGGLIPRLF